ncbi:MAG: transglutaminase-like domain-containing protein [Elusimicrobia bacterium]|nr:transglutaminase-like domain-containing protein [Elusimicrobiota bacterium]
MRRASRLIVGTSLVATALLAATPFIVIVDAPRPTDRAPAVEFKHDPSDHPRLRLLRQRQSLDQVVARGATEFDRIVLLRRWAHGLWPPAATAFYYPAWDAVEIIDLARRHDNRGFCAQYAIVFLQACRALGIPARYVNLGHFLTETWSNEYSRWVVMDPTNDIHFEKDGMPLDGLSLFEAAGQDRIADIYKIGSDGSRTPAAPEDIAPYRNYSVMLRDDQLTEPIEIESNGRPMRLSVLPDYRSYPMIGRDSIGFKNKFLAWGNPNEHVPREDVVLSVSPEDFRSSRSRTFVTVAGKDARAGTVTLGLSSEQTQDFREFAAEYDGSRRDVGPGEIVLRLKPGRNVFTARALSKAGWPGPASRVAIFYNPGWSGCWRLTPRRFR